MTNADSDPRETAMQWLHGKLDGFTDTFSKQVGEMEIVVHHFPTMDPVLRVYLLVIDDETDVAQRVAQIKRAKSSLTRNLVHLVDVTEDGTIAETQNAWVDDVRVTDDGDLEVAETVEMSRIYHFLQFEVDRP